MLVQHRLAVFDFGGKPTGGYRVPSFGFGQSPRRADDQLMARRSVAGAAVLECHPPTIASLELLAMLLTRPAAGVSVASDAGLDGSSHCAIGELMPVNDLARVA